MSVDGRNDDRGSFALALEVVAMHCAATRGIVGLALSCLASSGTWAAEGRIGNTEVVRNSVTQVTAASSAPIQLGDDVFSNEKVRTGQDSAAKFVFSDSTNLAVGASAQITLDRFVYKGEASYAKAAVNFAAGTFRFTTGGSDKGAYQLKTATATIGVRGTQFDLSVRNGLTKLTLLEGEVAICPRSRFDGDPRRLSAAQLKAHGCLDLTRAGQTAQVSKTTASLSGKSVNFAGATGCGGGLCTVTAASETSVPPTRTALDPSDPALCYANPD